MPNIKDEVIQHGIIAKGASVSELIVTDDEMVKINKYTLAPLEKSDVYVFKVAICDNDIDRQYEKFSDAALLKMVDLFVGVPFIKDHERKSDNQVARIYDTQHIVSTELKKHDDTPLHQLIAHCYVLDIDSNKNLIAEIKGGIKKEVSVGLRVGKSICNICGTDNTKTYCEHWWGRDYDGVKCIFTLDDPVDAFEVSFVPVPAQAKAGTMKEYFEKVKEMPAEDVSHETNTAEDELNMAIKSVDTFIYIQTQKEKKEQ